MLLDMRAFFWNLVDAIRYALSARRFLSDNPGLHTRQLAASAQAICHVSRLS
jgi:hypothetical protein